MDKTRIIEEMHEFENIIGYKFKKIENLSFAMQSVRIHLEGKGANHKEYSNEGLATVGDAVLKLIIADYLYNNGSIYKGDITRLKEDIENNATMHQLMLNEGWIKYSYNEFHFMMDDPPQHEMVTCNNHDSYIEALVGAIFHDSDYETVRDWAIKVLLPLLKKYIPIKND